MFGTVALSSVNRALIFQVDNGNWTTVWQAGLKQHDGRCWTADGTCCRGHELLFADALTWTPDHYVRVVARVQTGDA